MTVRGGIALVFALIGLAVMVSFTLLVLMYFSMSRGPSVPSSASLVLRPDGGLPELPPDDVVGQFFGADSDSVRTLVESLQRAKEDPRITSVLLRPGSLELPYWAKVQELRDAVMDFRESGKPVIAYLEFGGDREYLPGQRRRSRVPAAIEPARSDGRRLLRDLSPGRTGQAGRPTRLPAHR